MNTLFKPYEEHTFPDWTIEEFDAIECHHHFSGRYQKAKENALKKYRRKSFPAFHLYKAAAAVAACIALPVCVYAAVTHTDFFRNVFGNTGRQSTAAHEEMIEDGKGGQVAVIYPEREYVSIDEQAAETLIGDQVFSNPISVDIQDHTLTILSAVRDENAIAMEFTLECDTGVTALNYDDLSNETKGAYLSDQATFIFEIEDTGHKIYVDMEKSTDTSVHGYYYGLYAFGKALEDGAAPVLNISWADKPWRTLTEEDHVYEKKITIPAEHALKELSFLSETGGCLKISPISCRIDMSKGLGLTQEEAHDPIHLNTITIRYLDDSEYKVYDRENSIDNTSYLCGSTDPSILLAFNRLIDPANIESVVVNDVSYSPATE